MNLKNKDVLVYGAGKSGIGATDLLVEKGAMVTLFDEKTQDPEVLRGKLVCGKNVKFLFGEIPADVAGTFDFVVLSPGVPTDLPKVNALRDAGLPILGEVELAYLAGAGCVLAITGTNGKTTTTSLLGKIMADHHPDTFVVGNIGIPYTSVAAKMQESSYVVAEISSFQLETIETFHPHISAILNITEDHLNRHHTMEEYTRVKERIAENQTEDDFCILNYEDEALRAFGEALRDRTNVIYFSSKRRLPGGIFLENGKIVADFMGAGEVLPVSDLQIIGVHNYENAMAAAAMAICAGVPMEEIRASMRAFTAVPHRIEFVKERNGVVYYNDSKGTNPDAAIKGIEAMSRPTFLIGGGYDKGSDYRPWINAFGGRVKYLVLEGKTKDEIRRQAIECGFPEEKIIMRETMLEALDFCMTNAAAGDAVLLSPACASWGEFDNYEQRGDIFREYVRTR